MEYPGTTHNQDHCHEQSSSQEIKPAVLNVIRLSDNTIYRAFGNVKL